MLSDFLFRLRTLVALRRASSTRPAVSSRSRSIDFSERETGFPKLAATLKLQAYVYGTDAPAATVPPAAYDPSAEPNALHRGRARGDAGTRRGRHRRSGATG